VIILGEFYFNLGLILLYTSSYTVYKIEMEDKKYAINFVVII
jgi:hypothetical protein